MKKQINGISKGPIIFLGNNVNSKDIDDPKSFYQTGLVRRPSEFPWLELKTDGMKIIPHNNKLGNKHIPTKDDLKRAAKLINEFNEFIKTIDDAPFFTQANKFIEHRNKEQT